jgi:hypothetical protein
MYLVSSLFLEKAYEYLMRGPRSEASRDAPERLALVSGIRFGPVRICDLLLPAPLAYQSAVAAQLDRRQLSGVLRHLDRHGHALYMVIHSHTHGGPPSPSSTDFALQAKLEAAGYPVIQAVFSRTGHIRFFSKDQPFEVLTYGTGIERLDYRLYRLAQAPAGGLQGVHDETTSPTVRG